MAAALMFTLLGGPPVSADTMSQTLEVAVFQPAGVVGGGVLTPGTEFPPDGLGTGTLLRSDDRIEVHIETSGLPEGAYTVWWVVFNRPENCAGQNGCISPDVLNMDAEPSAFWATGGMVGEDGGANFQACHFFGDFRGAPGTQNFLDFGFGIDPEIAEIHSIIKYHGPASSDMNLLHDQVTTLLGSCDEGANAHDLGEPIGVHCFDPQLVVFPTPQDDDDDGMDDDGDWGGFAVDGDGSVHTDDWMGSLNVAFAPFVFSMAFDTWIYMPEPSAGDIGAWGYLFK